ncbi:MAG: hypothetical protein H6Q16_683 [Bacteroidetes bacterium]|nr:hypothetical protein [Bacteroidota bacterium]
MDSLLVFLFFILFVGLIARYIGYIIQEKKERELLQTVTSLNRGSISERELLLKLIKEGIPVSTIFHDLYLEKSKGFYSQIDVVVATKVGIIVFEVKDYSGWIFGKGYQTYWTQILAYGEEKYKFYNPVIQNQKHIETLRHRMKQCANVPFFSIIVFYGNCTLKNLSSIPEGIFISYPNKVSDIINSILENNPPVSYTNKKEVVNILKEAVVNGNNPEIQIQHIQNIKRIINKA